MIPRKQILGRKKPEPKVYEHKYYVIHFLQKPFKDLDDYVCIPRTWIRLRRAEDQKVFVSFPGRKLFGTNADSIILCKQKREDDWKDYLAEVVRGTDSYSDAQSYIKQNFINKNNGGKSSKTKKKRVNKDHDKVKSKTEKTKRHTKSNSEENLSNESSKNDRKKPITLKIKRKVSESDTGPAEKRSKVTFVSEVPQQANQAYENLHVNQIRQTKGNSTPPNSCSTSSDGKKSKTITKDILSGNKSSENRRDQLHSEVLLFVQDMYTSLCSLCKRLEEIMEAANDSCDSSGETLTTHKNDDYNATDRDTDTENMSDDEKNEDNAAVEEDDADEEEEDDADEEEEDDADEEEEDGADGEEEDEEEEYDAAEKEEGYAAEVQENDATAAEEDNPNEEEESDTTEVKENYATATEEDDAAAAEEDDADGEEEDDADDEGEDDADEEREGDQAEDEEDYIAAAEEDDADEEAEAEAAELEDDDVDTAEKYEADEVESDEADVEEDDEVEEKSDGTAEVEENYTDIEETDNDMDEDYDGCDDTNHYKNNEVQVQKRQMRKFILPPEYDENDSKWTLKHRKPAPGLVELIENSGVYVDAKNLNNCVRLSDDCKTLARKLIFEVFNESALSTCSVTGARARGYDSSMQRPGLDSHARTMLLTFVRNYGTEKGWSTSTRLIIDAIRNKMQRMRITFDPRISEPVLRA